MGMDVFGKAPTSEEGKYFRNNVWWWHPLWSYCEEIAPELIPEDNPGHFNDGWGLDAEGAIALADRLAGELASGATAEYARQYQARLEALPPQTCTTCGGTGKRAEPPNIGPGSMPCNGCDGSGKVLSMETHYPFSEENVREFEAFLRGCGGFEIC